MKHLAAAVLAFVTLSVVPGAARQSRDKDLDGFHTVMASAMRYVVNYEQQFALLAAEETYEQELQRPSNPGTNLDRNNPGGGMIAGRPMEHRVIKSDFLLVQLGMDGEGWMPFRDTFEVSGKKLRQRDDRLLKMFQTNKASRFEDAAAITAESTKHYVGNVARTINIPGLALMFLHPRVNERFVFNDEGEETIAGRVLRRASYREEQRPTLIKTTRGRDLALTGRMWIDPLTGAVLKTELNAADPIVRCQVTVTYRKDEALGMWVPEKMEEFYKAAIGLDDILATATYSNFRKFQKEIP